MIESLLCVLLYVFMVLIVLVGLRDDAVVMASHAIFPRDGGMEAPASVVGLQFQHSALLSRFISITSETTVSKFFCIYSAF
jgi:hypothetical protein